MELKVYLQVLIKKWWLILPVFLITVGVTLWLTLSQVPVYEATTTYILRPNASDDDAKNLLSGLDVLSRRAEIASTYAEVANSRLIKERAAERLGISSAQRKTLSVDSQVLAGTNVLEMVVSGNDPALVRDFANTVGDETITYVEDLYETTQLAPLDRATLPTSPVKPNTKLNLAMGVVLGLVLGVGLAFVAYYLEIPLEPATTEGVAAEVAGSDSVGRGEAGAEPSAVGKGTILGRVGSRFESPFARRRATGLIIAAILTLLLIAVVSVVWFTGRGTSAASLPSDSVTAVGQATATWTSTVVSLTDTPLPMATPTESATATAEPSPTVCVPPEGWMVYVVREDDTLSSLAARYGVSAAEIVEANCLTSSSISQYQTLLLPPQPESPTPTAALAGTMSVTVTSTVTPTATATASPTPTFGPSPTPEVASPAPRPTKPPPTSTALPAPVLLAPLDRQEFQEDAEIVLRWEPVGELPADAYYAITVRYSHFGETWQDDVPWTRATSWALTEHAYLLDLADNGWFEWSVQVMRQTGEDADGRPTGVALSAPSEVRMLVWNRRPTGGGGNSPGGTPPVPPP